MEQNTEADVSINAMSRHNSASTFRLQATVDKQSISILVDTGSTNTFLDETVAKQLQIELENAPGMMVHISNGTQLCSALLCPNFSWKMQGHVFHTKVRILPLKACEMVLGVDWLKQHSPVQFDFASMKLTLIHQNSPITLQATTPPASLEIISAKKLSKLFHQCSYSPISHLFALQNHSSPPTSMPPHPP